MAVAGAVALLLFGPDQLPKVARRAGQLVRDVQNTSQSFIREMERAADAADLAPVDPSPAPLPTAPAYHETPEPASHELVARETALEPPALAHEPATPSAANDPHQIPLSPGQPAP
jgi:Sec-independent protein translocase protein TatA